MCGISGIVGTKWATSQLKAMVESQHHRGPDANGLYIEPHLVGLGHNRLSIIDLSAEGNQPMHSADGRFVIVFNGEVYNYLELRKELERAHSFRSQTDTEVVLRAFEQWGPACLDRFIGMFSFAIWDREKQTLFAARDRFGVKPFNYSVYDDCLFFASEIKALWAAGLPRIPDEKVWASYFTYGTYGMPYETFWQNVKQLPAGHYLEWKNGKMQLTRWYDFESRVRNLPVLSEEEAMERWLELASESICLRFRSDVQVGFNLSGGLDSSLLLALVHRHHPKDENIGAFTFYTGDDRYDELPWVEEMIRFTQFGLNAVKLSADEVPVMAEVVQRYQDEPYGGIPTIAYSKLFQKAREKGTIVLLDGQGMDEAWAGYDYYQKTSSHLVQGSIHSPLRPGCLLPHFRKHACKPDFPRPFDEALLNLQYRDLFFTKIPRALRFNDRISMMHSTELREPFLDHRLVELAFALPESFKIRNGQGKWLARKIAGNLLPDKISLAPKRPLQTPQREWLRDELAQWVDDKIQALAQWEWFNEKELKSEWEAYRNGKSDNSFFIWQWVSAAACIC